MYRVLKPGGWIVIQMGYGSHQHASNYYEDYWEAEATNSKSDVMVNDPNQIKYDLKKIGFKNFSYEITKENSSVVNDAHEHWIIFKAQK